MKKWQRLLLTLAVILIGCALFFLVWTVYAHFVVKPLASCLEGERAADLCQIRWNHTNTEARELELTGERLDALWEYLDTVPVSPALRGRSNEPKGNYYIAFYKQDAQLAELILSPDGEIVILRHGGRQDYQARLNDGELLALPLDSWEQ